MDTDRSLRTPYSSQAKMPAPFVICNFKRSTSLPKDCMTAKQYKVGYSEVEDVVVKVVVFVVDVAVEVVDVVLWIASLIRLTAWSLIFVSGAPMSSAFFPACSMCATTR